MYSELPKNSEGVLGTRAVRYTLHRFFSKKHGWLIPGLEHHGMRRSTGRDLHELNIIRSKAPALSKYLLGLHRQKLGLNLDDVAALAVVIETLIIDDTFSLFGPALKSVNVTTSESMGISLDQLDQVVFKHLYMYVGGTLDQKGEAFSLFDSTNADLAALAHEISFSYDFASRDTTNPFKPPKFDFKTTWDVAKKAVHAHGVMQNDDCNRMRRILERDDTWRVGRLPLSKFYNKSFYEMELYFAEPIGYLEKVGALDGSVKGSPQVLIPNYLTGPSNCVSTALGHMSCCLSTCEDVMLEIEAAIGAPAASAAQILKVISKVQPKWAEARQKISKVLKQKLDEMAMRHHGAIPIHGRLFAQWLHFVYPRDCAFPNIIDNAATLSASKWTNTRSGSSESERRKHVIDVPYVQPDVISIWEDTEVLPIHENGDLPVQRSVPNVASTFRIFAVILASLAALRLTSSIWLHGLALVNKRRNSLTSKLGRTAGGNWTPFVAMTWLFFHEEPNADLIHDVQVLKPGEITRILRHLGVGVQRSVPKAELELQLYNELIIQSKTLESVRTHLASRYEDDLKLGPAKAKANITADCINPSEGIAQHMDTCNTVKISADKAQAGTQHKCELCGSRVSESEYVQADCNGSHITVSHKACWRQHFGGFSKKQAPCSCACTEYLVNILVYKADPETGKPRVAHTIFSSAAGGRIEELSTCCLNPKKTLDTTTGLLVESPQHTSTRIATDTMPEMSTHDSQSVLVTAEACHPHTMQGTQHGDASSIQQAIFEEPPCPREQANEDISEEKHFFQERNHDQAIPSIPIDRQNHGDTLQRVGTCWHAK